MTANGHDIAELNAGAQASLGIEGAGGEPLSDPAAEQQLLGALLLNNEAFAAIVGTISEAEFTETAHRRIFAACERAFQEGYALGPKALIEALGGDEKAALFADGTTVAQYIAALMANCDTSLQVAEIATHLFECAERRAIQFEDSLRDEDERQAPFVSKMGLRMWRDQNAPGPQYEYLIEDLIPERQCVLLIGDTQTGKSFLATHLSMCGVRAKPFFGRRVLAPFGVVWCAYEAAEGAPARMRAYRKHHDLALEDLPFGALTKPLKLWPDPELKNVDAVIAEIQAIERTQFNGVKLGMVVIDTHNAGTPGASEIDSEVISKIRDHYHKIVTATGATLLIVGHTNASGKHRGNEQLSNNVDTIIKVSLKVRVIGRDVIQLKDDDRRDIRTMRVIKQREGQNGDEHDFILRVVEDGTNNKFGKARTSCVVAPPNMQDIVDGDAGRNADSGDRHSGAKASKGEILFLQCVIDAMASDGIAPPPTLGLPRSIAKVVDYDFVKQLMAQKMLREDDNTPEGIKRHKERVKSAVKRTREGLMHIKVIGANSPYIWWTGKAVRGMAVTQPKARDLLDDRRDDSDLGEFV